MGRRCDLDVWTSLSRVLDLCSAHFRDGRWPAAIGLNLLLLLYEGDRSRRRWRLGHDGAFLKPCWRSRCNLSASTNYASLLRSNRRRGRIDLRGLNFPAINFHHVMPDRARRGKGFVRCGGYAVRRGLVHVFDVGDVFVDDDSVVVIIYDRGVHRRIRDVDVSNVGAADAIRRHVDFTRRQREPGDADSTASADSDAYAKVWPADPGDKRGSVNRAHVGNTYDGARRARHPAPDSANRNPAAVMEWRKAPRSIIYPGPAPGRNPHPVAVAIGRPADDSCVWKPNRAVLGHLAPASVFVEIFIPNHIGRDIA